MAQSVLMVYEDINSLTESEYWTKYINFYERYWDGPATPQSSWWGQEYENFRESLSEHLGIEKFQHILFSNIFVSVYLDNSFPVLICKD